MHASCVIDTAAWDKANHIIQVWGSSTYTLSVTGYRDMNRNLKWYAAGGDLYKYPLLHYFFSSLE